MSQENDKEIKGHDYDGITEYDNPLPIWWLATFIGTVIFAFIYFLHYQVGDGPTLKQDLTVALAQIEKIKSSQPADDFTEEQLETAFKDNQNIALGSEVFAGKCAVCHGVELQGVIGSNLVDQFWINTKGTKTGLVSVVNKGVVEKGMPAWKDVLKGPEILAVSAFIYSKKGNTPANPKAPQGDKFESY
ncbi:MAG: cbb3-type cytochrome c oxidase N-terminal domain-containing protein [Pseudobdellovibrio sp.]